jgi:hypothetical protein
MIVNTRSLIENLKSSDKQLKVQSMQELMTTGDSAIDIVIAELSEVDDDTIYWALDGIDFSELDFVQKLDKNGEAD